MILTLTPNPTIDRVIFVHDFRLGAVVRGEREVVTPSGKGVDSSLVIHELGGRTVALGLNAGHSGYLLTSMLDDWGLSHEFVPAQGETRTAILLVDQSVDQQSTISAPTLTATEEHLSQLLGLLDRYAEEAQGVIFAGSLPPGLPTDSYAHLIRRARQHDLVTLLDTSGEALRQAVAGGPHILKINRRELAQLDPDLTADDQSDAELAEVLAGRLGQWASDALIVTLGERGALAATTAGHHRVQPPEVPVVNTAGAGDALNGGILLARSRGDDWPAALALGTAAAASVIANEGTAVCRREQVEELLPQARVRESTSHTHC
ncbi:MAG: Tagatose-6-phosphate kinase [Anaerolineales bacterium]|nr:Tagatose-6-phosphate kinase [Anaerolineales bacterium]